MSTIRTKEQINLDIQRQSKACSTCGVVKSFSLFNKSSSSPDGYYFRCTRCRLNMVDREKEKERKLKSKYGIDVDEYKRLIVLQDNRCAICGTEEAGGPYESFKVDHCHDSLKVRGLLCQNCNLGLGHFKDNTEFLQKAIEYLNENRS